MQFAQKIPKMVLYIIVGGMFVYAFVTGVAIMHIFNECLICTLA